MKKIITALLSAILAAGAACSFVACSGEPVVEPPVVSDGVFENACIFSMNLELQSKQTLDLSGDDDGVALLRVLMQLMYGEIYETVVGADKPSVLYSAREIYFLEDGRCMIRSVSSPLVRDYSLKNHGLLYPGMSEADAAAEIERGEVKTGGYRIAPGDAENEYVISTSLEDAPTLNYDFATGKITCKGKFEEEEYSAVLPKAAPESKAVTYDYSAIPTDDVIEKKYLASGDKAVASEIYREKDTGSNAFLHKVWYPEELTTSDEKYPLVVMANGTGATFDTYPHVFERLASRGFIVVGNDNTWAGFGDASEASLKLMLALNEDENSKFYGKIDTDKIGSAGHSQGGAGAVNAVLAQPHGNMYKAIYSASNTSIEDLWSYDPTKINIPFFAVTAENDALATMDFLNKIYEKIDDGVTKTVARRLNSDHGKMLTYGDGYMTAWFLWHLKGDEQAKTDFSAIATNAVWTDVQKNF